MTREPLKRVNLVHVETENLTLPDIQLKVSVAIVKKKLAQARNTLIGQRERRQAASGCVPAFAASISLGNLKTCSHAWTFVRDSIINLCACSTCSLVMFGGIFSAIAANL